MTKNVCVMGLGFVGFPMAIALANVKGKGYIKYKYSDTITINTKQVFY